MSSQDNDQDIRVVAIVLISAILLSVCLAVGIGISKTRGGAAPASSMAAAPAAAGEAAATAPMIGEDASVVVERGVVKFYFASGKADLAGGALEALGDSVAAAQAGKRLVISGFHDATGDAAFNAELARQRAMAVRDTLMGAGVAGSSIELKKPEQATGSGNNAEARRVEVMVAD
jgi:outer membrane protein OmpA-like peptidoglycan-associated protein